VFRVLAFLPSPFGCHSCVDMLAGRGLEGGQWSFYLVVCMCRRWGGCGAGHVGGMGRDRDVRCVRCCVGFVGVFLERRRFFLRVLVVGWVVGLRGAVS
jgi:hypothetical protein